MNTEQRVARLELELARAKRRTQGLLLVGASLSAVGFVAWPVKPQVQVPPVETAKELRTQRLVIVDEDGSSRMVLSASKDTGTVLMMVADESSSNLILGVLPDGSSRLSFSNRMSGNNLLITTTAEGASALLMSDKDGKVQTGLRVLEDGEPSFSIGASAGEPGVVVAMLDDGSPNLVLHDTAGNPGTTLSPGSLSLRDKESRIRMAMSVVGDGSPMISLLDTNERPRALWGVAEWGATLNLIDGEGRTRAELGASQTKSENGVVTSYPESSLLLYGADGFLRWRAP